MINPRKNHKNKGGKYYDRAKTLRGLKNNA